MNPNEVISHIEPKKKWLDVDLKGLWRYRDLYYMNVKRDLITQYKQTIMGPYSANADHDHVYVRVWWIGWYLN